MRPRHVVVDVLEPGEPEDDRAEEEAAVDVGPDEDDERDRPQPTGVRAAVGDEQQDDREQRHPDELRPQPERDGRDEERRQRRASAARAHAEPAPQADRRRGSRRSAPIERRAEDDEPGPAGDPVDGREDRPGRPTAGPSTAAPAAVNVQVSVGRDAAAVEDLGAGPQVVGQVDARQVRDQRGRAPGSPTARNAQRRGRVTADASDLGVSMHRPWYRSPIGVTAGRTRRRCSAGGRPRTGRTARAPSS